jgi:hypothetical protein
VWVLGKGGELSNSSEKNKGQLESEQTYSEKMGASAYSFREIPEKTKASQTTYLFIS